MKLSVVIVNYNVKHYVEQCLNSVMRAVDGMESEIFVVDNHSRDGSVDYLRTRFPQVNIIDSLHNQGFSRANNIAIRQSRGEYVLLLNPDTFVGETVLKECVRFMDEHVNAGGVGVRMLKVDGNSAMESRRGLPSPATAFYKMCGLCSMFPRHPRFGKYYMSGLSWDEAARIEVVSGAFFMLRRKAVEQVGLLDEDFFMYGEDIDLSCRLLKGGFENWYLPVKILHYKGESTQKSSFRYVHVFYDAMLIFLRKHYGHFGWWLSLPIKLAVYMKAAVTLVKMQAEKVRKSLGFTSRRRVEEPKFMFLGSRQMLDECRELAAKHGLQALGFEEASQLTRPQGHHGLLLPENKGQQVNMVYDVHAYQYADILEIFSANPDPDVRLATYDTQTGVMITMDEIYV